MLKSQDIIIVIILAVTDLLTNCLFRDKIPLGLKHYDNLTLLLVQKIVNNK